MHVFLLDETFYTLFGIPWRKPLWWPLLPACQLLFELLRKFGSISSRITETVEYIVSGKYCYISEMMNYFWSVVFPFLPDDSAMNQLNYGQYNIFYLKLQHPLSIVCRKSRFPNVLEEAGSISLAHLMD